MATFPHEKLSRETKKYNKLKKPFSKDNFTYNSELGTYFCPLGEPLYKRREYEYKNKKKNNLLDQRM